jgi:hypothetical protein
MLLQNDEISECIVRRIELEKVNLVVVPGRVADNYSIGRRNSNPKTRKSPKSCWRRTLAVIGGVSLGTMLDDEGAGTGIVRCTI